MLFYKANAELIENDVKLKKEEQVERAYGIQVKVENFFVEQEMSCHITVTTINYRKKKVELCIATRKTPFSADNVYEFAKFAELELGHIELREITLDTYISLIKIAGQNDFLSNYFETIMSLNLYDLHDGYSRNYTNYQETVLIDKGSKKSLMEKAKGLLCTDSLTMELERIYQGTTQTKAVGHPVHYLLQSDEIDARKQILKILLTSLYQNNRIKSRRYSEISLDEDSSPRPDLVKALYETSVGGTIVISIAGEEREDSEHALPGAGVIAMVCKMMQANRNKVLTIFCIQRKSEKVKTLFMENLGSVTIVPIIQETAFDEKAKDYLKMLAREHGATADRALYKAIATGKGYSAGDLKIIFNEWYDKRLKSKIYTQYANVESVSKQFAARKPKGLAIDELEQMIGLTEAKKVIHQALNFYKAQKLFTSKGFTNDRPAMHMVFTGNPGTAKTTVARLFAQIMKDNNLLSIGGLYELGRADLVGKYVGWTAPLVKQKFKDAQGSVLFIDEAYSLVDDKDGLYGDEAINTIVQEMENNREDMVVIFAGYPDKMEKFLQKNPGLRSRIAFHVPFADYNADELYQITELMVSNKKLKLGDGVREKLTPIYESALKSEDFGNGRYARNMFEKAVMKQASRLVEMDVDNVSHSDIEVILPDDFDNPVVMMQPKKKFGFAV